MFMRILSTFAFTALFSTAAFGTSFIIDLEHAPGSDGILGTADDVGTPIPCLSCRPLSGLGYSSVGIDFTSGTLFAGEPYPSSDPNNHWSSSSVPRATFSIPVYGISVDFWSAHSLTLYGLDINDNVIVSATHIKLAGSPGFDTGVLSVSSPDGIAGFTVHPTDCPVSAAQCNSIVNIDNFVFTTSAPVSTPEPAPLAMLGGGLASLLWLQRRGLFRQDVLTLL
jgi:hypothetical protein